MKYTIAVCALLGYSTKAVQIKMDLQDMTNEAEDVLM